MLNILSQIDRNIGARAYAQVEHVKLAVATQLAGRRTEVSRKGYLSADEVRACIFRNTNINVTGMSVLEIMQDLYPYAPIKGMFDCNAK